MGAGGDDALQVVADEVEGGAVIGGVAFGNRAFGQAVVEGWAAVTDAARACGNLQKMHEF